MPVKIKEKKTKTKEFFALAKFYEPFTMGGDVWHRVKYKVNGVEHKIDGFTLFSTKRKNKIIVHEKTTGGYICSKPTLAKALAEASALIQDTPDFALQIKSLGLVANAKEVSAEEAYKRLKYE